jgi:4-amino-4-deoxy-L-arabinose transferase-like glycosyltransferase
MNKLAERWWVHSLFALLLFAHFALALRSARLETPTVDEFAHLPAGVRYWTDSDFALYSKNPPLIKLWMSAPLLALTDVQSPERTGPALGWGPWIYGSQFGAANRSEVLNHFFHARLTILLLSLASGVLIYLWALRFGSAAALLAGGGFLLSPTVLAHAHLATVDIGALFFALAFCFYLERNDRKMSSLKFAKAGGLLGLALASKFTAVFLLPWLLVFSWMQAKGTRVRDTCLALLALIMTLNLCYGFHGFGQVAPPLTARSTSVLGAILPSALPLPLPHDFLVGFDAQALDAEAGEFGSFLMGQWSQTGWWYYNFLAFLFKEHLVTLALLVFSLFYLTNRRETWLIVGPLLLLLVPLSLASRLQIGVRYLLPIFPLLFLLVAMAWSKKVKRDGWIALPLLCWLITALLANPNYLMYFNPVARAIAEPRQLLLDSNLDWGQDLYRLRDINREAGGPIGLVYFGHVSPNLYGIETKWVPAQKTKGLLAVSSNFFMGYPYVADQGNGTFVEVSPHHLDWLRAYSPIREEGSILIFDIKD